jgi:hypothetical protein
MRSDDQLKGQNFYLSYGSVPAIMKAPAPLAAKQWAHEYYTASRVAPPLAIIAALATGYTAYHRTLFYLFYLLYTL